MRNVFTSQNTGHYNNGSVSQTQSSYVMQQFPYGDQQQYNAQLYSNSQGLPQQTNHPSYRHNTEQPGYAQLYHSQRSILGRSVGYPRTYFSTGSDASGTSTPVYTNIQPAVPFGYPRSTSQQPPQQVVNPYIYQSSPSHTSVRFQSLAGPGAQSYVQQGQQSLSHQENHNNARTQSSPNQDIELQKEANAKRTADSIAQMRQNLLLEIIAQTEKESMRPAKRALNAQTGVGFDWGENFPRIGEVQSMCDRRQNTPPLNSPDIVADLNISESSSRTASPHRISSQKTSLPLTKIAEVIVAGKLDPILARLIGEHSASPNTPMSQSALQAITLSPVTNTSLSTVNAAPSAPVTTQGNVIAANQNTSIFPGQNVHFGISSSVHKLASEITAGHFNPYFQRIQNQMNANVTPVQATSATPQYDSAQHQIVNPVAESPIVPSLLNQSAPPNQSSSSMPTVSQSVAVRQPGISREPASTQVVSEVVAPPLPVISCCLSLAVPDRVTASSGSTSLQKSAEQPQMQRGPSLGNYVTIGKRIDYVNDEDGKKDGEKETETNGDDDVVITLVTTKDAMRGPVEVIDVEDFIPSTGIKIKEEPEDHPTVIASTQNGTTPTAANNTPPVESGSTSTQSLSQESSTRINSVSGSPPMESGYMQSSPSNNTLSGIPDADNGRTRSASQNSSSNIDLLSQVVSNLTTTFYLHSLQRAASLTDSESSNDEGMSTPVEDQVEQAQITPTPSYIVKDLKVIASEALRKMARPADDQDIFDQQGMFLVAKPVPNEAIPSPVQEAPSAEKSDSESCDYTSSSDAHVVHVPDKSAQPSKTSKKSGADLVKSLIKTREKIRNETIDFKRVFLQRLEKKFEKCLRKVKSFEEYSSDYVDQLLLESTYLRAKDASMESRDSQVQDSGRASVCESEESTLEQPHISVSKRQSVSDSNANSEADYEVVPNNPKAKQETHNNECLVSHNCNAVPLDDESQNVEYSKEESSPVASVEPQHEEDEVFIEPADLSMEAPSPVFQSPMSRLFSEEPEPGSEYEKQVQKETYYSINLRNEADDCLKPLKSYTAVESRGQIVHPDSNDEKEKDLAELMKSGVATGEKESDGKEQSGMRASGSCGNVGIGEGRCGMVENPVRIEKRIDNRNVSTRKGHKRTENYNDRKRDGKEGIDGKRERLSSSSSNDFQQSKMIKHSHLEKSLRQAMRELEHSSENSSEEEKRKVRKKKLVEFKNKHGLDVKKMDESEKREKVQQVMSMFNSTVSQHSPDSRGNSRGGSLDNVSQQRRHSPQTCPEINEPQSPKSPQDLHKTLRDGMNIVPVNQGRLDKNIKKDHNKLNNKEYPIITAKQGKSVKKRSKGRLHEIAKRLTLINSGHSSSIRRGSNVKEKGHNRMDVRVRHASCTRPVNDESSKGNRIRQRSPVNADGSRQRSPVNADGSRQRSPVNADGSRQWSPVNADGSRHWSPVNADGPRQRSPVNANGSRQRSPFDADGPRQRSLVNSDCPRQRSLVNSDCPRQRSPVNADGSRQWSPVNADGSRQWSPVNDADGPRQWFPVNADGSRQRSPDTVMKRSQASNETTDITRHVNKRTTDTETTRRRSPETTLKRPNPSSGVPYEGAKKSRESFSQERRFEVHTKNVKLGEKSGVLVTSLGTLECGERPCKTGPAEIARQGPGGDGYPKQDPKKKADTSPSSRTDERTKNFMTSAGNQLDEGRPRISGHAVNAPRDSGQGGILKTGNETQLSDGRPVKEKGSVCNRPAKSPSSDGHSPPSSDGDSPSRSIWSVFQW
ncbi:uncharacterized protein LOC116611632 isoform X2 [Nematostella vectensis]|uniref:uncharacterized protein LOC116611632 isoform X2 n=1 Tax=Nematostella vectensis TaxID=45351 RepID=UPI0020770F4F|nr:uncharacterized protein LOC116611632 isoform X2 [Nematostella vectensis]